MRRRAFHFVFFWSPAIVHVLLLAVSMGVTLQNRPPPEHALTGGVGVVLAPLWGARSEARTVITRSGDVTFRRSCEAGRCELFGGDEHGYTLLASYPEDQIVDLRAWPEVEILRIHDPARRRDPSRLWLATIGSGLVALLLLGMRLPAEHYELGIVEQARDAVMTEEGELRLDDGRSVCVTESMPPGPALALHRKTSLSATPYRDAPVEIWNAVPGSKTEHLLQIGRAIGATKLALIFIACADVAAIGTILGALT